MIPANALRPETTHVFLALLAEYDETGRATMHAVAKRARRSSSTTHKHLWTLRLVGLADWDDKLAGTLRPLVHPVAA